jgi:hypothetical protein
MRLCIGFLWLHCALIGSTASAQADSGADKIPSVRDIVSNDIFVWVVLGALLGFVINATHPDYEGIRAVFSRYGRKTVTLWITMPLDLVFFALLGPLIVTAAYAPAGVFQGVTLGLGWPLVIRGAVSNLNRNPPNPPPGG